MAYSGSSPITGAGRATAAQINRWMAEIGQRLAPGYAPDKRYQPPPATLGDDILRACQRWAPLVNQDIVASQIAHETAGWQSEFARSRNNPAGLGAINSDPGQAIRFSTPYEGVLAQVAHLLAYAVGDGPWRDSDPRFAAVSRAGWLGVASTLDGLNGRWAFPGTSYGTSIAAGANDLLTTEGGPVGTVAKPPILTDIRAAKYDGYTQADGMPRRVEAICRHISNGREPGDLQQLTKVVSSNYYINKSGVIRELVPPDHNAWTNGDVQSPDLSNPLIAAWVRDGINPNTRTLTIEHEGVTTNGAGNALTEAQWESTIRLGAWLSQEYGLPADRVHNIGHYQINSVTRDYCPGFSAAEWERLINGMAEMLKPANPSIRYFPETGFIVGHGFLAFWEQFGNDGTSIRIFGYPLTNEYTDPATGLTIQVFERAIFEYHPENPPEYTVLLRRLGADALEAA